MTLLPLGHRVHELVVQYPGRGVAHAELVVQRQAGLGLADQIDRQEPDRQRQLRVLKQAAHSQLSLVAEGAALVWQMYPAADDAVVALPVHIKQSKPLGPLICATASAHCSSVPKSL